MLPLLSFSTGEAPRAVLFPSPSPASQPAAAPDQQPNPTESTASQLPLTRHFLGRKNHLWLMEETSCPCRRTKGWHTAHKCRLTSSPYHQESRGSVLHRLASSQWQVARGRSLWALHPLWKIGRAEPSNEGVFAVAFFFLKKSNLQNSV